MQIANIIYLPNNDHFRVKISADDCSDLVLIFFYQYVQGIPLSEIAIEISDRHKFLNTLTWIFLKIYKAQPF